MKDMKGIKRTWGQGSPQDVWVTFMFFMVRYRDRARACHAR
jgi:hypothetical protein